jgi:hypothetical protein
LEVEAVGGAVKLADFLFEDPRVMAVEMNGMGEAVALSVR